MIFDVENLNRVIRIIDFLNGYLDLLSQDLRKDINKLYDYINKNENSKVYVITNNSILNDEVIYGIYGVAFDKKEAKKMFNKAISDAKLDFCFDEIKPKDFSKTESFDEEWYYDKTDNSFELFLNGNYNSNNYCIEIREFNVSGLTKNKNKGLER